MTTSERTPWPFPGSRYDWNTDDELGAIIDELRLEARLAGHDLRAGDLSRLADGVERVRRTLTERVQLPSD